MTTEQHPDPDNPPSSDEYVPSRVVDLPDGFVHEDDDEAFDAGDDPDARPATVRDVARLVTERRIGGQRQQPIDHVVEAQLRRTTQHTQRLDPTQLGLFNRKIAR